MGTQDVDASEEAWRRAFKLRTKEARGSRSQEVMADLLGLSRDAYSKYEALSRDTVLPTRLLVKFAHICGKPLEWLIEGPKGKADVKRKSLEKQDVIPPRRARSGR